MDTAAGAAMPILSRRFDDFFTPEVEKAITFLWAVRGVEHC